jgi:hypothetical protein
MSIKSSVVCIILTLLNILQFNILQYDSVCNTCNIKILVQVDWRSKI